jgi:sugar phosphate isomerase/epimerase
MRFGVCEVSDKAAQLAAAGYDYIELGAGSELVPDQDEAAWNEKRRVLESLPLPCEAFNLFIRGIRITGPDADPAAQERYAHTALARAAQVGGKLIVFGSGGARRVPDGYPREQAEAEILRFLGFCADAYEKTGVMVVVEPLNTRECNIINSVAEGAEYVRRINRHGVRNLADSYHMEMDGEPLDAIVKDGDILAHAHTADTGRVAPGQAGYDHVALFRAFRAAGYDARLSVECNWKDFSAEIGPALDHLKRAYAAAQTV